MKSNIKKKTKVIIFDFDGTLYIDKKTLRYWDEYYTFLLQKLYEKHFGEQKEYKTKYTSEEMIKIKNLLENLNINVNLELNKLQDLYPYPKGFWKNEYEEDPVVTFDNNFIKRLFEKYNLYICSDSTLKMIQEDAKALGLDLKPFKQIFINEFDSNDPSKKPIYRRVMQIENDTNPEEILVIGNSIGSDIAPAEELGFSTILLENESDIKWFTKDDVNNLVK